MIGQIHKNKSMEMELEMKKVNNWQIMENKKKKLKLRKKM